MKSIPRFTSLTRLVLAGSVAVLMNPSLYAASATWSNTAGNTDFNADSSWVDSTQPGTGGTANFTGAAVANPNLSSSVELNQLTFSSDAANYNIGSSNGSSITLGTVGTNSVVISGAFATGSNTISSSIILASGTQTFAVTGGTPVGGNLILSGDISETGGTAALRLTRLAGTNYATYTLSGNNTFSGGVSLEYPAAQLNLGSSTALGSGTFRLGSGSGVYFSNVSGSALTFNNAMYIVGNGFTMNGDSGYVAFTGPVTMGTAGGATGTATLTVSNANAVLSLGAIGEEEGAPRALRLTGTGTLILGSDNTYSGNTHITTGTLSVSKMGNTSSTSSSLGKGTGGLFLGGGGQIQNGTLLYTGAGETSDRSVTVNYRDTGWIMNNGSGGLTLTSDLTNIYASGTFSGILGLGGTYRGVSELQGDIYESGIFMYVRKEGPGTWVLSGDKSYSGTTTVNGGTLVFDMKNSRTFTSTGTTYIVPGTGAEYNVPGGLILGGGEFKVVGNPTGDTNVTTTAPLILTAHTGSRITIDANGGDSTTLNFGDTIWTRGNRAALGIDLSSTKGGAQRLVAPATTIAAGSQSATSVVAQWATVTDSTGIGFAVNIDGYIERYTGAAVLPLNVNQNSTNYKYEDGGRLELTAGAHGMRSLSIDTDAGNTVIDIGGGAITFGGLLTTGGNDLTFENGTVLSTAESTFHTYGSGDVIINANIGSGAASVAKMGSGTLVFNGVGAYTGNTNIYEGTLRFAQRAALYNGDTSKWTSSNIRVQLDATLALNVGGANEFTASDVSTLLAMTSGSTTGFKEGSYLGLDTTSGNFTYNNAITDSYAKSRLGLKKLGANALTLTGANTYTGDTIVAKGSLNVNGSLASGLVVAASGAKLNVNGSIAGSVRIDGDLGGSGSIAGATLINGRFAPGNSIGTLSTGDLTFGVDSVFDIELGVSSGVAVSDQANVTGTVNILDGAELNLTLSIGTVQTGDLFFLINNDGTDVVTGSFILSSALGGTALTDGSQFSWNDKIWKISYHADAGSSSFINGNDVALMVVPEPSTWALLTGGLGMLVAMQGMRRRAKVS